MASKKQKSSSNVQCFYLKAIDKQKQLVKLSKMAKGKGHALIADVLVVQVNISNELPTFQRQLLLQNTSFISLISKLTSAMVKQEIDTVIKNIYFKLSANNITPSTLKEFFLGWIKINIKADALFLYSLIREVSSVKKVNDANSDKNMFATTFLAMKSRNDRQFWHGQR